MNKTNVQQNILDIYIYICIYLSGLGWAGPIYYSGFNKN